jgi:2,3-bisphosphoglycerate-dependent phosphoglycerate mutase
MSRTLALVRHGQSEWNQQKRFTGWRDPDLTPIGVQEAQDAGRKLLTLGVDIEAAFCSALRRARHTLDLVLTEIDRQNISVLSSPALNERDYGDLSGMSKTEARERWGAEQVHIWRRSYDIAPPNGESLKDTVARVVPYFNATILPVVMQEKPTIVAAHGNSLRALTMALEQLTPETVSSVEISTADLIIYKLDDDGKILSKKICKSANAIHES